MLFLDISRELKYFHPFGYLLWKFISMEWIEGTYFSQLIIWYLNDNYKICFSIELTYHYLLTIREQPNAFTSLTDESFIL